MSLPTLLQLFSARIHNGFSGSFRTSFADGPLLTLLSTNAATQSTDLNQLALQITADPEHGHRSIS